MDLAQSDFEHLLELRTRLRRFLSWSEQQAKQAGLTPAKHRLLLTIKGHPDPAGPSIGGAYRAGLLERALAQSRAAMLRKRSSIGFTCSGT